MQNYSIRKIKADLQPIILTGYTEADDLIGAINSGRVYQYITKPRQPKELSLTVKRTIQSLELSIEAESKERKDATFRFHLPISVER